MATIIPPGAVFVDGAVHGLVDVVVAVKGREGHVIAVREAVSSGSRSRERAKSDLISGGSTGKLMSRSIGSKDL